MTTLALVSDLHGNLSALEALEEDLSRRRVDKVAVLGDLVGYLTRPNRVAQRLALRMAQKGWLALAGNHDLGVALGGEEGADRFLRPGVGEMARQVFLWTCRKVNPQIKELLGLLPPELRFELGGRSCLAVHGSPLGALDYVFPDRPDHDLSAWLEEAGAHCLFMGHTHMPFVRRLPGGLAVNPGSLGQPKDGDPRASYALVDLENLEAEIVRLEYDLESEAQLLQEAGFPAETVQKLRTGT